MNRPLLCFDIEATGVDPAKDRIVQIAWRSDQGDQGKMLINPNIPIPPEATAIHGITDADVAGAPTFYVVADSLHELFKRCDLVGFNLTNFDVPLLWEEFNNCGGIEWDLSSTRIIDAGTLFKRREERTLAAAVQFYCGRELVDAHDAMNDVNATWDVLAAQIERYKLSLDDRETLERESNYEEKRLDLAGKVIVGKDGRPAYNIGKVKGTAVEDDPSFAVWMLGKDFSENTKRVLRGLLYQPASILDEVAGDGDPF